MMSVSELLKKYTDADGNFLWGINTVMNSLCPNCLYELKLECGVWSITRWDNNWSESEQRYLEAPTEAEIKQEYARQKTIAEVVEYYNSIK